MTRAQLNMNGSILLAVTPAGANGLVTGAERNKLQKIQAGGVYSQTIPTGTTVPNAGNFALGTFATVSGTIYTATIEIGQFSGSFIDLSLLLNGVLLMSHRVVAGGGCMSFTFTGNGTNVTGRLDNSSGGVVTIVAPNSSPVVGQFVVTAIG